MSRLLGATARPAGRPPGDALAVRDVRLATILLAAIGLPMALRCWLGGAPRLALAAAALVALGPVNVLTLRRFRRVRPAAHGAVALVVATLATGALASDGLADPPWSWLLVAPPLAFLLTGLRGGWAWTGAVGAVMAAVWTHAGTGLPVEWSLPPPRALQALVDRLAGAAGLAAVATAFVISRRRAEQALVDANAELHAGIDAHRRAEEEAVATASSKTSFLAHMSHEIRTPMVGILGASELLLQTHLTARQRGLATTIETSTRSLLGILNNVLDLSRMDAGRLAVSVERVDAQLVCEDVADLLAAPAASRDVDLVVAWTPGVPRTALADPLRLRQILVNLVGNAVKFTERGHVAVRASLAAGEDGGRRLRIAVEDTGIGITDAKLATLFEPFVQADLETTRRYGGSGLGLAITKQLVELMGGEVGATSAVGRGSTFWFTLPLAPAAEAEPAVPASLAGQRALVVSDRPATAAMVADRLRRWGLEVETAGSVEACGPAAQGGDVLLVDARVADAASLWVDGVLRPDLPRRTILLVPPRADALRLSGNAGAHVPLPLRERALLDALAGQPGADAMREAAPRMRARVLVADDVEINREVVRQLLEQIGCTVDLATSGAEAVEQCRARPYDLVLMDCHMPQLDGFQAAAAIRGEDGPNRSTAIVALTASALSDERERCARIGMNDYLTKPVGRAELAACLRRFLGARESKESEAPVTTPAAPSDRPAVLDVEATLNRIGGNTQLFERLITIFRRQTPPLVTELRDALAQGDAARVRAVAHKLNGSLRSVGGRAAQEIAAVLEQRAAAGSLAEAHPLCDTLAAELARLDDAIGGYLAGERRGDAG